MLCLVNVGTPYWGYRQWPLGPTSREVRAYWWGQIFYCSYSHKARPGAMVVGNSGPSHAPSSNSLQRGARVECAASAAPTDYMAQLDWGVVRQNVPLQLPGCRAASLTMGPTRGAVFPTAFRLRYPAAPDSSSATLMPELEAKFQPMIERIAFLAREGLTSLMVLHDFLSRRLAPL